MKNTPINHATVSKAITDSGITDIAHASIREIVKVVNLLIKETGVEFLRMEMGVPGLPSAEGGIKAEIEALKEGVASVYPDIEGHPELKTEASRFVKLFLATDVKPECCVPTGGAMMGAMAGFMVANRNDRTKEGTLFLDPGFPVQKTQTRILGQITGLLTFIITAVISWLPNLSRPFNAARCQPSFIPIPITRHGSA
jgi:aspartate/methionine/tyrosine aminotransferase